DLFDEYVIVDEEKPIEEVVDNPDSNPDDNSDNDNSDSGQNPDNPPVSDSTFESKPNNIVGTFYPKSAAEISNPDFANHKAIIETSFDCDNCNFAENLTIETAGGVI